MKACDSLLRGRLEGNSRSWIQCDQVDLCAYPTNQLHQFAGVFRRVVHLVEEHIFKGQLFAIAQGKIPRCRDQLFQVPLAVDGHEAGAGDVIRCVERNGQFRPHRLRSQVVDAGHDPRRGHRHARLRDPHSFHQEPHGRDEIVVVEERLAHSHEDQIDPLLRQ